MVDRVAAAEPKRSDTLQLVNYTCFLVRGAKKPRNLNIRRPQLSRPHAHSRGISQPANTLELAEFSCGTAKCGGFELEKTRLCEQAEAGASAPARARAPALARQRTSGALAR
jgi:hypothetical protein